MKQIPRILLHYDVDRVQQPLQVSFFDERRAEVRHDEIADEQHAQIRQVDEQGIVSFTASHGNELDVGATDFQFGAAVDSNVGSKAAHIVEIKAFAEKFFAENGASGVAGNFFFVV